MLRFNPHPTPAKIGYVRFVGFACKSHSSARVHGSSIRLLTFKTHPQPCGFSQHNPGKAKSPTRALDLPPAGRAGEPTQRRAMPKAQRRTRTYAPTALEPPRAERAACARAVRGVVRCGAGVGRAGGGRFTSSSHYSKPACPDDDNFYFPTLSF